MKFRFVSLDGAPSYCALFKITTILGFFINRWRVYSEFKRYFSAKKIEWPENNSCIVEVFDFKTTGVKECHILNGTASENLKYYSLTSKPEPVKIIEKKSA